MGRAKSYLFILALASCISAQDTTDAVALRETPKYQLVSSIGGYKSLINDGGCRVYMCRVSYSLNENEPMLMQLGVSQDFSLGILRSSYYPSSDEKRIDSDEPRIDNILFYAMTRFQRNLYMDTINTIPVLMSVFVGGGISLPIHNNESKVGAGFIVTGGGRVEMGKVSGEISWNLVNTKPRLFPMITLGYQPETLGGALVTTGIMTAVVIGLLTYPFGGVSYSLI